MHQKFPDWVFHGWLDLEDDLNNGWQIERVDTIEGLPGGFLTSGRSGGLVYILSKKYKKKNTKDKLLFEATAHELLMQYMSKR